MQVGGFASVLHVISIYSPVLLSGRPLYDALLSTTSVLTRGFPAVFRWSNLADIQFPSTLAAEIAFAIVVPNKQTGMICSAEE